MSMRSDWRINGRHFRITSTERGGQRYFIDGVPTPRENWHSAFASAKAVCTQKAQVAKFEAAVNTAVAAVTQDGRLTVSPEILAAGIDALRKHFFP